MQAAWNNNPLFIFRYYPGNIDATPQQWQNISNVLVEKYDLDKPLITQYFHWMGGIFTGHFPPSWGGTDNNY